MSKKKLFEDIRRDPPRFYRTPTDVPRDRRFGDVERMAILHAWRDREIDAIERDEIDATIARLAERLCAAGDHAAQ